MNLRPLHPGLFAAAGLLLASPLRADRLEIQLRQVERVCVRSSYGEAPWCVGRAQGFRFSARFQASSSRAYPCHPLGFLLHAMATMIVALQEQAQAIQSMPPASLSGAPIAPVIALPPRGSRACLPRNGAFGDSRDLGTHGDASWDSGFSPDLAASSPSPSGPGLPGTPGAVPGRLAELPQLTSASQIGRSEAEIILEAGGYFGKSAQRVNSGDRWQKALRALGWGWTFKSQTRDLSLDTVPQDGEHTVRQLLFLEYQLQVKAYSQYANLPDLTAEKSPREFDALVARFAPQLNIPTSEERKRRLMEAVLYVESTHRHWMNHELFRSWAGAGGTAQIMAGFTFEKEGEGRNYYHPEEALAIHVQVINNNLRRADGKVHDALAMYNGGPGNYRKAQPQAYASKVLKKAGW